MPSEKATAIVLRVVEFSETSSIVTLFTREFGKLSGLAKGARRPKGPFESALDLLAQCRVVFLPRSSDALNLLTEAKLMRRFRPPGRALENLYAAYYVAELLGELTDDSDPHPQLFDAADRTLVGLMGSGSVAALTLRFELDALRILGHVPSLEKCVECGAEVPAKGRVPFGQLSGGVLCGPCRKGKRQIVSVSAAAIETLRRFADQDDGSWQTEGIPPRISGEVRAVLAQYLNHLLGHKLRLHAYLGNLRD